MKLIKALFSLAITGVLIWALQTKFGAIPPLGKFLNPTTGFWQNAESMKPGNDEKIDIKGLDGQVTVRFDENHIPHVFAQNEHDLYMAQGYLTTRDRLWQMDIQTRSAAGRLAEVVGPSALSIDRYHRRMGMVYGAENTIRQMMQDPVTRRMLLAYTAGVNSYIRSLSPAEYPIEFKLLNYAPEEWQPINCAFLLKLMSETLAGGSDEFAMSNVLNKFGPEVVKNLFPDYPYREEPIIPKGTPWNFKPLSVPKPSDSFMQQMHSQVKTRQKVDGIGSNNWAVSGSKTATGYPMLANDPHLHLTFPSIWYQIQLAAPGVNVNGVSLPGAPGIIIGYNQKVSWGVTNVDADVLDWYQINFKDNTRNAYWYNNRWNPVKKRVEVIKVKGQPDVIDTVLYTHHGPVVYTEAAQKGKSGRENVPINAALRWIAHDASNEFMTFYLLNRAQNYNDYRKALTYYTAPAQNFVFADADKDIAITPNGKLPLKFKDQGKFLLDGSDPGNDWHGWIPADQNPTAKNPAQGYLASANQSSTDPSYPYYINWQFGSYQRGKRINNRLTAMNKITVDSMRRLQLDDYSIHAYDVLPAMLRYVDSTKLTPQQQKAYTLVKHWNLRFSQDAIGATVFQLWWQRLDGMIWDEFGSDEDNLRHPSRDRTVELILHEPQSKWFDNATTPGKETCEDIISNAFNTTVDELVRQHGQPGAHWAWSKFKGSHIDHLASLPAFGSGKFIAGGSGGVINALTETTGPSWRMVVQLGPQVKGFGVYPGGQSGNPGSPYYKNMLQTWQSGQLNELLYLQSATEASKRITSTLTLNKK
ncbi:penicillin acylase family protein [Mucilaginibacter koreensis]